MVWTRASQPWHARDGGPENLIDSKLASFAANQPVTLRITRQGNALFTAFINGTEELSFIDTHGRAVFNAGVANFFLDDTDTNGEFSAGRAEFIAVEAAPVPVPAALPLLGSALGLRGWRARRRRS